MILVLVCFWLLVGVSCRFFDFNLMHGCICLELGAPYLSFVCCYFTTLSLALLVLDRTHCDFNKFSFGFFKNKTL